MLGPRANRKKMVTVAALWKTMSLTPGAGRIQMRTVSINRSVRRTGW